jgi:hypothetical protein
MLLRRTLLVNGVATAMTGLLAQARRTHIDPRVGWTIAAMDVAWVLGSVAVVETGILTMIGTLVVAAVALVVLVFAILEIRGLRGLRTAGA